MHSRDRLQYVQTDTFRVGQKKNGKMLHSYPQLCQMPTNFKNSFTTELRDKLLIKLSVTTGFHTVRKPYVGFGKCMLTFLEMYFQTITQ